MAIPGGWLDPRAILATNLHSQRGIHALLIGSGVSTAVGMPTGWGVVEQLVRRVAAASHQGLPDGEGWEEWWARNSEKALGYSALLEELAPTAPARQKLLASFFEPTEEDRAEGRKVPGAAHEAIAKLVAKGVIRVIVTTNFDRLLELALEREGVSPQVVSSEAGIEGMEPLQHPPATIIKLHGDYASLDQRNTVEELSNYSPKTADLLEKVLDEYGLIVSGWSGEWDRALVDAIGHVSSRRYPLFWAGFGQSLGGVAQRLTARSGTQVITDAPAESFFPDLLSRLEAVEQLAEAPASLDVKIARLRRALPDPVRHLELRTIFEEEIDALRKALEAHPHTVEDLNEQKLDDTLIRLRAQVNSALRLFVEGIYLDRDRAHTELWVWVLQGALNAPRTYAGGSYDATTRLSHYPAMLLLRAGVLAALAAGHEDVVVQLCRRPTWRSIYFTHNRELAAHQALHLWQIFEKDTAAWLPRWNGPKPPYPESRLVREDLRPLAEHLVGTEKAGRLLDRMEYRLALADTLIPPVETGSSSIAAAGGEYLGGAWLSDMNDDRLHIAEDFVDQGDYRPWMGLPSEPDIFEDVMDALHKHLRAIRAERSQ